MNDHDVDSCPWMLIGFMGRTFKYINPWVQARIGQSESFRTGQGKDCKCKYKAIETF